MDVTVEDSGIANINMMAQRQNMLIVDRAMEKLLPFILEGKSPGVSALDYFIAVVNTDLRSRLS